MVRRLFRFLQREISGLHNAAYLLAVFALLSQVLAVVRDRFLAKYFGAGEILDVYYLAFRIPDLLYVSIASFVAGAVLIPFLTERSFFGKDKMRDLLNSVFTVFSVAILLVAALIYVAMPFLADLIAPGIAHDNRDTLIVLARILLLSPILLGVSNLIGSVTQASKRFFAFAAAPVFYNLGIIFGIVALRPAWGIEGVVWGVVIGAVLHVLIQIPGAARESLVPKPTLSVRWHEVREVVKLSLPRTLTLSASHLAILILLAIGSLISTGAVSIFSFSYNLQSVPLSIIGVSYSVAAFPTLSSYFTRGEGKKFGAQLLVATKHILFWSLPVIALFIVLRAQIVRTLLGSGEFTWTDTRLTAAALAIFSLSVAAQSLILLFVRAYYAAGRTLIPLAVNLSSSILIVCLGFYFSALFKENDMFRFFIESLFKVEALPGSAMLALPLAFSTGMLVNAIALFLFLRRDFDIRFQSIRKSFFHSLAASVFMGYFAWIFLQIFARFFDLNTFIGIFLQGALSGMLGIVIGMILLWALDNEEIRTVFRTLHRKFWRARPIAPSDEGLT